MTLTYPNLGLVYGDLSTSPLYVYKSTFAEDIQHSESNEEIYGVMCFVFWTQTIIPLSMCLTASFVLSGGSGCMLANPPSGFLLGISSSLLNGMVLSWLHGCGR